jgi:hypothetical protein
MRSVYIDADACPVTREAIAAARKHRRTIVLVGNESQNFARHEGRSGVDVIRVGAGRDAADFAIVERLDSSDVVVTQDIGLAAMVLGRGARVLSPRGRLYARETIDMELEVRHAEAVHRRSGGRARGPAPFEDDDRERFASVLDRLLAEG